MGRDQFGILLLRVAPMIIKSVDANSLGKLFSLIGGIWGLLFSIEKVFPDPWSEGDSAGVSFIGMLPLILVVPFLGIIGGFLAGAVYGLLFNIALAITGGLRIVTVEDTPPQSDSSH